MTDAATRARKLRKKDAAQGVKQVNVRIPDGWDTTLQMLARELRNGGRLEGFVIRDMRTGKVKTVIA